MQRIFHYIPMFLILLTNSLVFAQGKWKEFPYKKNGIDEERAAIHLLSRFTFGFKVKDIIAVRAEGLEKWFDRQLSAHQSDVQLHELLFPYKDAQLSNKAISEKYFRSSQLRKMMVDDGYISKDSVDNRSNFYKEVLKRYLVEKGYGTEQDLLNMFKASKVLRAAYTENQLQEVMTDFWFNHFNVSLTKSQASLFVPAYENYVIRPNALDKFDNLLVETAKSPAMLMYLDNFSSTGIRANAKGGINENYARELMELHTLGIYGRYTQVDVSETARVLTGWTIYPMQGYGNKNILDTLAKSNLHNIIQGDFVFVNNRHDKGEKKILGQVYKPGYKEGEVLLRRLALMRQTARFICRKIAVRFVSDNPKEGLVSLMATRFMETNGDIKEVLKAMVYSSLFWEEENFGQKIKTPFELALSSVRALDADIENPKKLNDWVTRMGEQKYYYVAPTGFPDRSDYWINTGALLNRMNFGLSFPVSKTSGVSLDLLKLNGFIEPESAENALEVFAGILLPVSDVTVLKKRLSPLLTVQNLKEKVKSPSPVLLEDEVEQKNKVKSKSMKENHQMLMQVVGLIIGSPEFQRR